MFSWLGKKVSHAAHGLGKLATKAGKAIGKVAVQAGKWTWKHRKNISAALKAACGIGGKVGEMYLPEGAAAMEMECNKIASLVGDTNDVLDGLEDTIVGNNRKRKNSSGNPTISPIPIAPPLTKKSVVRAYEDTTNQIFQGPTPQEPPAKRTKSDRFASVNRISQLTF